MQYWLKYVLTDHHFVRFVSLDIQELFNEFVVLVSHFPHRKVASIFQSDPFHSRNVFEERDVDEILWYVLSTVDDKSQRTNDAQFVGNVPIRKFSREPVFYVWNLDPESVL